jgi:hypothetical protein
MRAPNSPLTLFAAQRLLLQGGSTAGTSRRVQLQPRRSGIRRLQDVARQILIARQLAQLRAHGFGVQTHDLARPVGRN